MKNKMGTQNEKFTLEQVVEIIKEVSQGPNYDFQDRLRNILGDATNEIIESFIQKHSYSAYLTGKEKGDKDILNKARDNLIKSDTPAWELENYGRYTKDKEILRAAGLKYLEEMEEGGNINAFRIGEEIEDKELLKKVGWRIFNKYEELTKYYKENNKFVEYHNMSEYFNISKKEKDKIRQILQYAYITGKKGGDSEILERAQDGLVEFDALEAYNVGLHESDKNLIEKAINRENFIKNNKNKWKEIESEIKLKAFEMGL